MSEKTTPNKNVQQKLFAFRKSVLVDKKKPAEACDEQEVLITFEDDVRAVGNVTYFFSTIHFTDIASGQEMSARAYTDKGSAARQKAYAALLGSFNQETTDNASVESKKEVEVKQPAPVQNTEKPAETKTAPAPAQNTEKPAPVAQPVEKPAEPPVEQPAPVVTNTEPVQTAKPEAEPSNGGLPAGFKGWGNKTSSWGKKK